jgi:hypothetical protein
MYEGGVLEIHPEFQRDFVWQGPDQTRFIDSLIKALPIPSLCFAMDYKAQRWMVIDGLQRISTICRFLEGANWKLADLDDIDPNLAKRSAAEFKTAKPGDSLRKYFTRVENQTLPISVLRCDFQKKEHLEYLFTIFHRLNTGGLKLNNQEIRNCIFGGQFNQLLHTLDQYAPWRKLNRMKDKNRYRFTKQEIILRFFAFHDRRSKYKGQVAKFLNDYMQDHRNPTNDFMGAKEQLFKRTVDALIGKAFRNELPKRLPVTILEALLVGIAANLDYIEGLAADKVGQRAVEMMRHAHFSEEALAEGLAKKPKVEERMATAVEIFSPRP